MIDKPRFTIKPLPKPVQKSLENVLADLDVTAQVVEYSRGLWQYQVLYGDLVLEEGARHTSAEIAISALCQSLSARTKYEVVP